MADRCWCEKELEAVPSGGNPQEFDGAAECPDHGEKYVWRPCRWAGDPMEATRPVVRECDLGCFGGTACIDECATCRIPAQLDALEKARAHCGWLLSEFQEEGRPADLVESTQVVYEACKAALERGEEKA